MNKIAFRGLAARKLRTVLTGVAVVLGVAMVTGTYIETDQIYKAFENITHQSVEGIDVVVTPEEEFTAQLGGSGFPTLDQDLVDQVKQVDGVQGAEGQISALGNLIV